MKQALIVLGFAASLALPALHTAAAHEADAVAKAPLSVQPLAEKRVERLPDGPLFWRIENFPTLDQARAAMGEWSLAAQAADRVWLFTLGAPEGSSPGGTKVAEVGPIPRPAAQTYLLRINEARGVPGSASSVHSHPGSEAFFVLSGEQSIRTEHGVMRVRAGRHEPGDGGGMAMEVSSSGDTELHALVMFVVDAAKPFSSPAELP